MGKATLRLTGTFEAWAPFARAGRLGRANGSEVPVLVRVLEGTSADEASLAALREDGRLLGRLQHENVLRVEQTSGVGGKLAVVHENFDCVAMDKVLEALRARGQVLPARVAAEVAASVGIAVEEALKIGDEERRVGHPGPTPQEVLVDTSGRVKLAGLRVRHQGAAWPQAPRGYAPPAALATGPDAWQAATWMVGALLVELLTGEPPPDSNAVPPEAWLHKVVMKVLARPGDPPSELLVQAVRQALAPDAEVRGTPGAWGRMLREVSVQLQTPGLRAWAPGTVPAVQKAALSAGKLAAPRAAGQTIAPAETGGPPPVPSNMVSRSVIDAPSSLPSSSSGSPVAPPRPAVPVSVGPPPSAPPPSPPVLPLADLDEDPEPTVMGKPLLPPPPRDAAVVPVTKQAPATAAPVSRRFPAAGVTASVPSTKPASRPSPQVVAPKPVAPLVTPPQAPAGGPAVSAKLVDVSSGPTVGAMPLLPSIGEDSEFEATVVARPLKPGEPLGVPGHSLLEDIRPGASGPALAASSSRSVLDEEEPAPRRSALPWVLGLLAAGFIGATLLTGAVLTWMYLGDDELEAEPVPTLGDVVGAAPEAAPVVAPEAAPVAGPAAPSPSGSQAAVVAEAPPAAVAPAPAAGPAVPSSAPKATTPKPSPTSSSSSTASANPAPAAAPAPSDDGPVRIATKAAEPAPVAATPAPAPTAQPAADPNATYRVEFSSADPALTLEVKCMQGSGSGSTVVIDNAVRGNCRVTGRGGEAAVMTLVTVSGDRIYRCFANGARACQ